MALIKRAGTLLAALFFLAGGGLLLAQTPKQLGTEIQNLERQLSAGISRMERHDVLIRLARLQQLSGNIAGAAANWLEAADADPRDAAAFISGAYCLAAIGEWEKAASAIRPLIDSVLQGSAMLQARYLDAFLKARNSANVSALVALAGDSAFAPLHPMIYYSLWQIVSGNANVSGAGSAESWKSRLLTEFPQSPEARIAGSGKNGASLAVIAVQSPLWMLFPETNSRPVELTKPVAATAPVAPTSKTTSPTAPAKPATSASSASSSSGPVLQTGLFSKEANARAQSDALQKAGFTASVSRKLVNGADHWVVTVPAGQNVNAAIQALKKAGFDSFPVK